MIEKVVRNERGGKIELVRDFWKEREIEREIGARTSGKRNR